MDTIFANNLLFYSRNCIKHTKKSCETLALCFHNHKLENLKQYLSKVLLQLL